jgi:hypothetical protein
MKKYLAGLIWMVTIILAYNATAHHSAAPHFDMDTTVEVIGVVTRFANVNPHAYVYIKTTDAEWRCELRAGAILQRVGWDQETLYVGAEIKIIGAPARREDHHCKSDSISLNGGPLVEVMQVAQAYPSGESGKPIANNRSRGQNIPDEPEYLVNGEPNITGNWLASGRNPGGRARIPQTTAGIKASEGWDYTYDYPGLRCQPTNIFDEMYHDRHTNLFTQLGIGTREPGDDNLIIKYGFMGLERTIHINMEKHPDNIVPSVTGHSIGEWDGKTLNIHTTGFKQGALIPVRNILHSDQMAVEESFTVAKDGSIDWQFEATDPFIKTPFKGGLKLARTTRAYEPYGCVDLNGQNNVRPEE